MRQGRACPPPQGDEPLPEDEPRPADEHPLYVEHHLDAGGVASVHAATLVPLPGGGLRAWWYGGTREGHRDVALWGARFDADRRVWGPAAVVLTRQMLAAQLARPIKKLGTPVAVRVADGTIQLFFVSVSVGGWATSAVNVMTSTDDGASFGPARRLTTSPVFNVSTLVRTVGRWRDDGTLVLPVYHEFLGKFAELLEMAPDGRITAKRRLSWGRAALQPALVPESATAARVLLRYAGPPPRRMLAARTDDGGVRFSRPVATNLPNADNSVAGLALPGGPVLLAYNATDPGRHVLALAVPAGPGPGSWAWVHDVERGDPGREFSYPTLVAGTDGLIHLAYTHDRRTIKHVVFNAAWLRGMLARAGIP